MSSPETFRIKELDLDLIAPSTKKAFKPDQGGSKTIIIGKPGCFAPGTKMIKYDGTVIPVEKVCIGDQMLGDDSTPRNVLDLCHNYEEMYKITPTKGEPIVVNENHILSLKCTGYNKQHPKGEIIDITVKDFLQKSPTFRKRYKWYRTGVEFPRKKVELDPYLLGYWLGDGNSANASITTTNEEVLEYFDKKITRLGLYLKQKKQDPITYRIIQKKGPKHFKNRFLNFLRDNDLLKNKHIPQDYKINDRQTRLELLAGLLDSDGYLDGNGYDFIQKSEKLFDDTVFLARSLGFATYKKKCQKSCTYKGEIKVGTYYRCFISGNVSEIPCKILYKQASNKDKRKDVLVTGFRIKNIGCGEYYGFTLDGNHRFLLDDFSVVHNTGKTTLIASLLYAKKHIFPVGMVMSGSEDSNHYYRKIFPNLFVYNEYNEDKVKDFIKRQKNAKQHLENPWGILLLDDCTDDPRIFNDPLQHGLFKRGRHWKLWYILSLQYAMDVKPVIRVNVDGVFILREPSVKIRKVVWENYASIIPDFSLFCTIMDSITGDYTALYIHNAIQTNVWTDCVFYYKATPVPDNFRFGCQDYWDFAKQRFNTEYVDPLTV